MQYDEFLKSKRSVVENAGIEVAPSDIHPALFPFARDVTRWALRKGRAAIFLDTGMHKTSCQLEYARLITKKKALIVAPLSVAKQTVREARDRFGMVVKYCRSQADATEKVNITNYELIRHFDPDETDTIVCDESSILAALDSATRKTLTEMFRNTPNKLCCTATPIPNDDAEIGQHSEFLGIKTRADMLSTFFVHDEDGWRLKGHAGPDYYRWLSSWGISMTKPSDLGYSDEGFILPPLTITPIFLKTNISVPGRLFPDSLKGIQDRARVRKATVNDKMQTVVDLVNSNDEQWIVWTGLNPEAEGVHKLVSDSRNIYGTMNPEDKALGLEQFQEGLYRVLVSKVRICGFGMNMQNCHNVIFMGLSDSWQFFKQAIARCYRFGQQYPVNVYVVLTDLEEAIYRNILRKEAQASIMSQRLIEHVRQYEQEELQGIGAGMDYNPQRPMEIPSWLRASA
jgi:hypothetical protein